jgi:hypothetical protein
MKRYVLTIVVVLLSIFIFCGCAKQSFSETKVDNNSELQLYASPNDVQNENNSGSLSITVYIHYDPGCPRKQGLDFDETIIANVENGEYYSIDLPHKDGYVMYWEHSYYIEGVEDDYSISGIAESNCFYTVHYKYVKEDIMTISFLKLESDKTVHKEYSLYLPIRDNSVMFEIPSFEGYSLVKNAALDAQNYKIENGFLYINDIYRYVEGVKISHVPNYLNLLFSANN